MVSSRDSLNIQMEITQVIFKLNTINAKRFLKDIMQKLFLVIFSATKGNAVLYSKLLCPSDSAVFLGLCKYHTEN